MIKIGTTIYDSIKHDYYNEINTQVHNNIRSLRSTTLNPFTHKPIREFFEKPSGQLDTYFIKYILTEPLSISTITDSRLINYLKTGILLQYKNIKVSEICSLYNLPKSIHTYKQIRKEIVNKYYNSWIESHIKKHPNFNQSNVEYKKLLGDIEKDFFNFNFALKDTISYDILPCELRHKIIVSSGITVCPYCNRQYITIYQNEEFKRTTADLDHLYPQSIFTLFSLSLYNFVPSCSICNRLFKKAKNAYLLSPFFDGFGRDIFFTAKMNKSTTLNTIKGLDTNFDLKIENNTVDVDKKFSASESIKTFRLESVYQSHKNIVKDLLYKHNISNNPYYLSILSKIGMSDSEAEQFLYGYTSLDVNKPFSKLYEDIKEQGFELK